MTVAVVILNYNGEKLLKKFLPSALQHTKNARIVVADNHSSDRSLALLKRDFPSVERIQIPLNLGFCGGYNYALKRIEADYYALLNSDIEVTPNWIDPLVDLLEKDRTIGAVQPKIRSYREKDKFEHAGAAGGFIDLLGYPFCRGRIFNVIEKDTRQYDDVTDVFWITGACLLIRAELFKEVNGFDEDFFAHMEEIDLCWRLHRLGHRVVYCGHSVVYHVGGATLPASSHIKTYYNFRNGIVMLIKNMSARRLMLRLPIRLLLDIVAALKFFVSGFPMDALAVFRAHFYLVKRLNGLLKKRYPPPHHLYETDLIYKRSIVVDHFLMGKKSYSELNFRHTK